MATVTDHRQQRQTVLPVREIKLNAYTLDMLMQIIWHSRRAEPRPSK